MMQAALSPEHVRTACGIFNNNRVLHTSRKMMLLQPTARPLPRPILGLAVSESEMGFAATEGPLRAEHGVSPVASVVVQKVIRKLH